MNLEEKILGKHTISLALILIVGILLFLPKARGMAAHIMLSVIGLTLPAAYTAMTKRS